MKNFQPGGLRNRRPDLGGRPQSDVNNYAPKKRFDGNTGGKFGDKNYANKKEITLYKATCTNCGNSCEVPFRPDGAKPVLCRDCFAAKNAAPTNSANRDRFTSNELIGRKPQREYAAPVAPRVATRDSADYTLLVKQLSVVETKVNQILELIKASETLVRALPIVGEVASEVAEVVTATKIRKPKKVTPAIKKAAVKKKAAVAKKEAKKVVKKVAKK